MYNTVMPIFEYRCESCDSQFEKIVFRDSDGVQCPNCQSPQAERLFSTFAVTNGSPEAFSDESGPCGACGASRRGMCEE